MSASSPSPKCTATTIRCAALRRLQLRQARADRRPDRPRALVTGARVKIGYQAALKLLRAGARVVVTTRFPVDAAERYAREPDFEDWRDRLQIHGLDLRHTPSVERSARLAAELPRLDFIINNACQTVRRPAGFFRHLLERENGRRSRRCRCSARTAAQHESLRRRALVDTGRAPRVPEGWCTAPRCRSGATRRGLPGGRSAVPGRPLRRGPAAGRPARDNSWRLRLHEVPTPELLEVQLVNAIAPYILNARLKPLMLRVPARDKHIVNVSARWKGSSTARSRPTSTRTPTWRRRRST
jgi:NAD(P)-dependent dehydrogenase (short-subunit alcohol dehydrogenase family)